MSHQTTTPARVRWARLRFAIIGPLLSVPMEAGDLASRLGELAGRAWCHPSTGETIRFSAKSMERWYYAARNEQDPIRALERKVPSHFKAGLSGTACPNPSPVKPTPGMPFLESSLHLPFVWSTSVASPRSMPGYAS